VRDRNKRRFLQGLCYITERSKRRDIKGNKMPRKKKQEEPRKRAARVLWRIYDPDEYQKWVGSNFFIETPGVDEKYWGHMLGLHFSMGNHYDRTLVDSDNNLKAFVRHNTWLGKVAVALFVPREDDSEKE